MTSFKTLRQSGIAVNPGPRVAVGVLTIEIGGTAETVTVKSEAPQIQTASGERSFTIPTETVQNLPLAEPQLPAARAARAGRRHERRAGPAARLDRPVDHRHDGRRLDDGYGQQRRDRADERRVDRRSEGARAGLSGGIRPVERTADHGRQQERDQPFPRVVLQRAPQLRLEREQQGQHPQRHAEADPEAAGNRLLDRWTDREAGRQQQAVLLPRAGVPAPHRRERRGVVPDADRTGAARATSRRRSTTSATRIPTSRIRTSPASARPRTRPRASGMAACSAGSRPIGCTSPG